jgi:hypothetical protein
VYISNFLPAALAHAPNTSVRGLYYVFIYVSYNEILFLLNFFKPVQQNSYLVCERLHMAGLDNYNILQLGHLVISILRGMHDSISVQNLSISWLRMLKQSDHVMHDQQTHIPT